MRYQIITFVCLRLKLQTWVQCFLSDCTQDITFNFSIYLHLIKIIEVLGSTNLLLAPTSQEQLPNYPSPPNPSPPPLSSFFSPSFPFFIHSPSFLFPFVPSLHYLHSHVARYFFCFHCQNGIMILLYNFA